MVAGVLVSFVLAAFSIKYLVDQVIVGVVLNVLVTGLTSFLYSKVLAPESRRSTRRRGSRSMPIPVLSEIPIIGPVLFRQTIIVYLMYIAVFAGLVRAVQDPLGSAPARGRRAPDRPPTPSASTCNRTRFWNVVARRRDRRDRRRVLHARRRWARSARR